MDGCAVSQTDVTPVNKQDTLGLILEGVNDLKQSMVIIERRTDSALNLAFRAHQKASTAVWMRTSWAPFIASAVAVALSAVAVGVAWAR
jgi:hypothetical protein